MRVILLTTVFIFGVVLSVEAQSRKRIFEKGIDEYKDKEYQSAIELFQKIIQKERKHDYLYTEALFHLACSHVGLNDTSNAQKAFEQILKSNFREKSHRKGKSDLIVEPTDVYKNGACEFLANLALEKGDYQLALDYTCLADTVYPYQHFCGNALAANGIYMAMLYADCYIGLGAFDKALEYLFSQVFDHGLASTQEIVEKAALLISEMYSSEEIRKFFEEARASVSIEHRTGSYGTYTVGYVLLFNQKVQLPLQDHHWMNIEPGEKTDDEWIEKYQKSFTTSAIYRRVMDL